MSRKRARAIGPIDGISPPLDPWVRLSDGWGNYTEAASLPYRHVIASAQLRFRFGGWVTADLVLLALAQELHAPLLVQCLEADGETPQPADVAKHLLYRLPQWAAVVLEVSEGE